MIHILNAIVPRVCIGLQFKWYVWFCATALFTFGCFFFFHYFIPFLFAIAMSRFAFMHRVAYEMENRMEQGD